LIKGVLPLDEKTRILVAQIANLKKQALDVKKVVTALYEQIEVIEKIAGGGEDLEGGIAETPAVVPKKGMKKIPIVGI
jgi:hypothetical protein